MLICDRCDNKTGADRHVRLTVLGAQPPASGPDDVKTVIEADLCHKCNDDLRRELRDFLKPPKMRA